MSICKHIQMHTHSSVQSLSHVQLFATPWIAACQASLSITISRSSLKLTSIESVMPSNHLILCCPLLLLLSIFPNIKVFSNESALSIRWKNYWSFSSASVLPVNIQVWFSSGFTGLISLQFRDSQESSPAPHYESISSSVISLLCGPTVTWMLEKT